MEPVSRKELRQWAIDRAEQYERHAEEMKRAGARGHFHAYRMAALSYREMVRKVDDSR